MTRIKKKISLSLTVLAVVTMMVGTSQAALLDVGPVVTQAVSTESPINSGTGLGHGFPLWYRDTNRVPLELCIDRLSGMCLTAEPTPGSSLSFPNNIGDELFWFVGDASFDIPIQGALTKIGRAILVQAIEAAYATGSPVPGEQVSFARIRIRVDTPFAGQYTVTTPYKQFLFNITDVDAGINFTEDIGIAAGGNFTGALGGSVGPFLYCSDPAARPAGFIGNPNVPCTVLGSTFPTAQNPSNFFRVQGPSGFDMQTNQFSVMGKLYSAPISTPLTVDKLTYARDASGVQVSAFATTQSMSNNLNSGLAFPQNFSLTNTPSSLQLTGIGLPSPVLTTNNPGDGKFFTNTGTFALQDIPGQAAITNIADTPPTVKTAALVDEVKITGATFNPATNALTVAAESLDKIGTRVLSVYLPGSINSLGAVSGGQFTTTVPFNFDSKTYSIPPASITVKSDLGGEATVPVVAFTPVTAPVTTAPTTITPSGTGIATSTAFTFTGVANAEQYLLWVQDLTTATGGSLTFTPAQAGCAVGTACSYTPAAPLTAGHSYQWVVSANNTNSQGPASAVLDFNTLTPAAPAAIAPSGAGIATSAAFTFTGVANATQYRIWVQDHTAGTGVPVILTPTQAGCAVGTSCSYTPATPLIAQQFYQWVVYAENSAGLSTASAVLDFQTSLPTAPIALAPAGSGVAPSAPFTFTGIAGATGYVLYLHDYTTAIGGPITITAAQAGCPVGTACSYTPVPQLSAGHGYGWQVAATNAVGQGPFSNVLNLVVQ